MRRTIAELATFVTSKNAGVRDPLLISQLDVPLDNVRTRVAETYPPDRHRRH